MPGDIYRRLRALVSDKPSRFGWIDDDVAASGRPMSFEQLRWVKEQGITLVISLTEASLPREWINELGLNYLHEPIEDHTAPSPGKLKKIVEEILEETGRGGKVLIHCAAGLGRTGTALAAYLIKKKGLPPEEAIKLIREMRPGSIEPAQEKSIHEFYKMYG